MSATKILLKLTNINRSFGNIHELKDIGFEIIAGEVHVLLDEIGAGKSTLIKIQLLPGL